MEFFGIDFGQDLEVLGKWSGIDMLLLSLLDLWLFLLELS